MNIRSVTIENYRGYKEPKTIEFDNLTLLVGKNDIGKSTVFEAMDIFFGNKKADKYDLNIEANPDEKISISVEFNNIPGEIDIDEGAKTSLKDEFLLNANENLEIKKIFNPLSPTSQPKILVMAYYPKGEENLLSLKNSDLKKLASDLKIDEKEYNKAVNNSIRKAIWKSKEINLESIPIEIDKEDGKKIYNKLEEEMPLYSLFSADRKNSDQDSEIQDPIKNSVKEIVRELNEKLEPIKQDILGRIDKITKGTIEKIREMNPEVANSLKPVNESPAWEKAFNVTIESDGVPLNKRGSGVKRLVLINFFREEAERRRNEKSKKGIFYAIEEPETSQHPDWQRKLFDAFDELVGEENIQIGLTTHHPELAGLVRLENIRFLEKNGNDISIKHGAETNFKEIAKTLGVLPKIDGVKVCVCLEGPTDIQFFKGISPIFELNPALDGILWLGLGGDTLKDYVNSGSLDVLNVPQVHFYDQDSDQKYKDSVDALTKKNHWAKLTQFLTIENYIHPSLYKSIWPELKGNFIDDKKEWCNGWAQRNIPNELSAFIKAEYDGGNTKLKNYCSSNIKKSLAKTSCNLTKDLLEEMGALTELEAFFAEIKKYVGVQ